MEGMASTKQEFGQKELIARLLDLYNKAQAHLWLADFPQLGSVCRIHTCSYRSIRQIHSALQEIQTFTGGRLAGITAKLTVRPEEATYFDRKEKRKRTSSI
jgi:hypothetical protein